ncbi:MAG: DUF3604 domain-containing protein [Desulfobacterales bacterium]|nr:MAG: DUF3604 domain-containing protein [Desulfobacterales bacterium]
MDAISEKRLGSLQLEPRGAVEAGSIGQWTLTYTVGDYGIDDGGTIMLVQRIASDWQVPQLDRPDQPAYTTVRTTGNAQLSVRFKRKAYHRPWMNWCLVIDVQGGYLRPGDTVTMVLGDQSQGSPGIRAQTFIESAHEFRVLVDPTNAALVRRLPSSPVFPVAAGKAVRLVCVAPSEMVVGQKKEIFIKGEDAWGNPTPAPQAAVIEAEGQAGVALDGYELTATSPGDLRLSVTAEGLFCRSNPCVVLQERREFKKFWGDLHAQTESTVGTGTEEEYFRFGRDVARLDFISHQGNDFQVTDSDWQRLAEVIKEFNVPGKFVVFPGYEWSGNTSSGGDHNVIYLDDDQPIFRSSHWQISEIPENSLSPAHPVDVLFERLRENGRALLIPHVGGRYADIRRYFDEQLIPVVEIESCWGVFEWMLWDALEKSHRVGVVCNSDGHKGRPGAEGPGAGIFGIYGGLTCILAESLTREALFQAIMQRRCYGTTGPRIYLEFDAAGNPMGKSFKVSDSLDIKARAIGTAPTEALMLYEGQQVIHTVRPQAFSSVEQSNRIRISWEGSHVRGRTRRATWDGSISVMGTQIERATTFAFDSPADGIINRGKNEVQFKSSTTGDIDGIDLFLSDGKSGHLKFASRLGDVEVNLAQLNRKPESRDFGGLGLKVVVRRYPEANRQMDLSLSHTVVPPKGKVTPYFVKVVQEDGHMAWCSPVYVERD